MWQLGDIVWNASPTAGEAVGWMATASGGSPAWSPLATTVGATAKTVDWSVPTDENGCRYTNHGATAIITGTLPSASAGKRYHFTRRNSSYALRIDPYGAQYIIPGSGGKYVSLDTDGASVTIEYLSTNTWGIVAQSGTVTFEP
jgi:hypothetical protein